MDEELLSMAARLIADGTIAFIAIILAGLLSWMIKVGD